MMTMTPIRLSALCIALLLLATAIATTTTAKGELNHLAADAEERTLKVQYLEVVTPAVAETCDALAKAHDVEFGDPIAEFGNARTAKLRDGGLIGVRAPMRATEQPVVRPYVLVDDIEAAVKAAEAAGAKIALPPMPIPGQGKFSIYILGGIEHGLWQL